MLAALCTAYSLAVPHLGGPQTPPPQLSVKLRRVFTKGEKAEYQVKSSMMAESRTQVLTTMMPESLDYQYKFNYEVTDLKADGICEMRYKRPTITLTDEGAGDKAPDVKVEKLNLDLMITLSPINEFLNTKDLNPKKPEPKKDGGGGGDLIRGAWNGPRWESKAQLGGFLDQFIGEIHRLALYIGSLDSSMDFSPKLPFDDEVLPGATWKRTVGYSPQKSNGGTGKMAVQRLDFTYTYVGLVDSASGKKVQRVTADMSLSTDLAAFVHETFNVKPSDTGLKELPMNFTTHVDFDLDPKTFRTILASAKSEGGFKLKTTTGGSDPVLEEQFKSTCKLKMLTP